DALHRGVAARPGAAAPLRPAGAAGRPRSPSHHEGRGARETGRLTTFQHPMPTLTIGLAVVGLALLFGAPLLARLVLRRADTVALTRILQAVAVVLLLGALLVRPHNPETAAF